jgi:hypothetical protein
MIEDEWESFGDAYLRATSFHFILHLLFDE